MKYMFLQNSEISRFCYKNHYFSRTFSHELTTNFPELIKNDNDKIFGNMINKCIDINNNIDAKLYYKHINEILTLYDLRSLYCILLFTNNYHFVGSADIGFMNNKTSVTISNLFITKPYRGKKCGILLMKVIISKLREFKNIKKIILDVDDNNIKAIKLYEKFGFITIDTFGNSEINGNHKKRMELWL